MKNNNLSILHGHVTNSTTLFPTVLKMIANITQVYPNNIAIIHGNASLSYRELGTRAAEFAQTLRAAGVKNGDLIPICTDGGIDMIVSMVAIWAANAAFVPVDIHTPKNRLIDILEAVNSPIIVSDAGVTEIIGQHCISIEATSGSINQDLTPDMGASADDLVYGFFTSGSTGKPKCCLNVHSGLANRVCAMSRWFNLAVGEAVLQNSRHIFDSALWQIFWPLSVGAKVVIPNRESIVDIDSTLNEIEKHAIVTTDFVPSILELVLQSIARDPDKVKKLSKMRYLLVGGEAVDTHIVSEVQRYIPNVQLVNTYGPTEASIGMVFHLFNSNDKDSVPLGKPIDNTSVIIVDETLQAVPIGEVGEIVIGGRCLGKEYLNDPVHTSSVFIDNSGLPMIDSDRIYRTGDLGRIASDGLLYFNGRIDEQVKIAGVRIELGEIEHYMHTFDGVRQAKVVCINTNGQKRLAGFFRADHSIDISELRTHLSNVLSKSTIPSLLLQIEKFPRTASGKIDGKRLINDYCTVQTAAETQNQEGNTRDILITICQRFLPGQLINDSTDLVQIGMDSLQMLHLSLEIEKVFGKELPLWSMSTNITIENIANMLDDAESISNNQNLANSQSIQIAEDIKRWSPKISLQSFPTKHSTGNTVFLTGATGYVGANILVALLRKTPYRIVCLVRADNDNMAYNRLKNKIENDYELQVDWSRIIVILGDLTTLNTANLKSLQLHSIVHAAAEVNFMKNYSTLAASNVQATANLCQLAIDLGLTRFHYISSMSVLTSKDSSPETFSISDTIMPKSGYAQSKWAAEAIVHNFAKTGLPVSIYRLGEMMPDTVSLKPNTQAVVSILIKAALKLNVVPKLDEKFNYTPITVVADYIATCVANTKLSNITQIDNLYHPDSVDLKTVIIAASDTTKNIPTVTRNEFRSLISNHLLKEGNSADENLARASLILQSENALTDDDFDTVSNESRPMQDNIEWPSLTLTHLRQMTVGFNSYNQNKLKNKEQKVIL